MTRVSMLLKAMNRKRLISLILPATAVILAAVAFFHMAERTGAAVLASSAVQDQPRQAAQTGATGNAIHAGAPDPAIIDCLLQWPSASEAMAVTRGDVHISYPALGNKQVDEDIRAWVANLADAFITQLNMADAVQPGAPDPDSEIEAFLNDDVQAAEAGFCELWGAYRISRPSSAAVSVVFELRNYTGDREGNLDIITLNYSLITGQRLELVDIFEKPDVALELMSAWARKQLESRTGVALRAKMLMEGTEPLIENFSSLTLTPEGICINFQPWQVAPRYAGLQTVVMPLKELLPSAPLLALWGKGENPDERAD